jgi:hypothetical protein
MRFFPWLTLATIIMELTPVRAGIGGVARWELKLSERRFVQRLLNVIGDDGIAVARIGDAVMEFGLGIDGAPKIYSTRMGSQLPFARVGGKSHFISGGTIYSIPTETDLADVAFTVETRINDSVQVVQIAISANGDYVVLSLATPVSVQRWSKNGQLISKTILRNYGSNVGGILFLTSSDTAIIGANDGKLYAVSSSGEILWTRNQGEFPFMPTSTGGIIAQDRLRQLVKLTADGFPERLLEGGMARGPGLTPTDEVFDPYGSTSEMTQPILLTDGGWIAYHAPSNDLFRLSASGTVLWSASGHGGPVGVDTHFEFVDKSDGLWVRAIDLGARITPSAWPNIRGWPDGSRRARIPQNLGPVLTMLHHSTQAGAFLQCGTIPGRSYTLEVLQPSKSRWVEVQNTVATGFGVQFNDPNAAPEDSRIYRVQEKPTR